MYADDKTRRIKGLTILAVTYRNYCYKLFSLKIKVLQRLSTLLKIMIIFISAL